MKIPTSKLGLGPMSSEIIKAIFEYSQEYNHELMIITSKNQIDYKQGYVNNWNTNEYSDFIKKTKLKYPKSNVLICRDHCGPGFNGIDDINDCYKTLECDLENNFDLIHIDMCHVAPEKRIDTTESAINFCIEKNSNILLEIGTDENNGNPLTHLNDTIENISHFFNANYAPHIQFVVAQTGSLIKEDRQIGKFNKEAIQRIKSVFNNVRIKEHNSDYLNEKEIAERSGLISALNIAPQLGVIQTDTILSLCKMYNINCNDFLNVAYKSNKWQKWLYDTPNSNKLLCARISGHYVFTSEEYHKLIDKLNKHTNTEAHIINNIKEIILYYENNF